MCPSHTTSASDSTGDAREQRKPWRINSYKTQHWAAYCCGLLVLLPRSRAGVEPALVPSAETLLGMQREKRRVSRMRTVLDKIAEAVRSPGAMLNPPEMAGPSRPAQALHAPMRPMPVPAL